MALVDLNADGVTDLVLAGPAEQHSQIGIGDGKSFDIRELPDEAEVEVLGVLALDVDADGDEDLYLSCSGVSQAGAPGISVARGTSAIAAIEIRWPDGQEQVFSPQDRDFTSEPLLFEHPSRPPE
jgi:hypothetical protein